MERDADDGNYRVLVNEEEQYSLWLGDLGFPNGWKDTGVSGKKAECLKYVGEVWTDMRPKSLREHMDTFAKSNSATTDTKEAQASQRNPDSNRSPVNELVQRLSIGLHPISADRYKSMSDFKQAIDSGYVLLKFTETKGGTELGVCLDRSRMVLNGADFEVGTGTVQVCGTLLLNYNEVEFPAEIDIATLKGKGRLNLIADEPTCRARQAQREGREENRDTRG